MAKVAFTGTTAGLTDAQAVALGNFMDELPGANELHHGVAEGADAAAHVLARLLGWSIVGHPGVRKDGTAAKRAYWLKGFTEVLPELPMLKRNRAIVAGASILLATPRGPERMRGSGTWATVRYARAAGVPVLLFWPDGSVVADTG